MKSATKFLAASVFAVITSFSATASASVYALDYNDAGVWHAYDSDNETYAMKFRSDQGKDGFWLVVTDGNNPKGDGKSNAILYGDIANNRITAYTYNGENASDSYTDGTLLGAYEGVFSSGGVHPTEGYDLTMFSINVSDINNALGEDFNGVQIAEKAGIWFHQSDNSDFTYGDNGSITNYAYNSQMWLDRGNNATVNFGSVDCMSGENSRLNFLDSCGAIQITTGSDGFSGSGGGSVPSPGGLALILVGLVGLYRKFHRTNA